MEEAVRQRRSLFSPKKNKGKNSNLNSWLNTPSQIAKYSSYKTNQSSNHNLESNLKRKKPEI